MTREKAIKRLEALLLHVDTDCVMGMETTEAINMAIKALEQPERKKGTWIILIEDLYGSTEATCSECGFEMLVNEPGNGLHDVSDLHYCPNCGADMRTYQP